jgi:peptidyl-prolyl cis-trans isomerase A (cyclophilin A)
MEANVVSYFLRFMTVLLFIGAAAFGMHSASAQSPPPTNLPGVPAGSMPSMPAPPTGTAATIPGASAPGAAQAPGPAPEPEVGPTPPSAATAAEMQLMNVDPPAEGPPPSRRSAAPKTGPTPFVPSEVERVEPESVASKKYKVAILRTSLGDIVIRLFSAEAPQTVENFIQLARGTKEFLDPKTSKKVNRPFYNGLIFHRVIKGFMIQTGCPFGNGHGDPGYSIKDEKSAGLKFEKAGMVAMALAQAKNLGAYEKDSNGSQFFITLSPQPSLDKKFTIFGEVTRGLSAAEKIRAQPTDLFAKFFFTALRFTSQRFLPQPRHR